MICAKMAEPIDLPFVWVVDSGGLKEAQVQSYLPDGATWRIRLNRPSVAAMGPYVKLL